MEPELTPTTEALYGDMPEIMRLADKKNDYALKQYLAGAGDVLDIIQALAERIEYLAVEDRDPDRPARKRRNWIPLSTFGWNGESHKSTSFMKTDDEVLTNLATNPSFETTSGTVEVYRNLATNPSFEAKGSAVEVWRNMFPDPATQTTLHFGGWSGTGGTGTIRTVDAPWGIEGKAFEREVVTAGTSTGDAGPYIAGAVAGETWTIAFDVEGNRDITAGAQNLSGSHGGSIVVASYPNTTVLLPANTPTRRAVTFIKSATANADSRASIILPNVVGAQVRFSNIDLYPGPYQPNRPVGSGSFSPDSDLTPSWTGAVNNSESVLTGARPTSVAWTGDVVAIQSKHWSKSGDYSIRVIKTASGSGEVELANVLETSFPVGVTAQIVMRLDKDMKVPSVRLRRRQSPWTIGAYLVDSESFTKGEHVLSATALDTSEWTRTGVNFATSSSYGEYHLPVGESVWFDNALVIEGVYNGPYFDGDTSPDADLTPSWAGAVNNSASVLSGRKLDWVSNVDAIHHRAYQSEVDGSSWLKITPIGTSSDTSAGVYGSVTSLLMLPGRTYTALAKLRLDAPQTGTLNNVARSIVFASNSVAGWTGVTYASVKGENRAGEQELRLTFTVPTDAVWSYVRLYNGASAGGGDVWWDNLTIMEGNHPDLMPFSGDTPTLYGEDDVLHDVSDLFDGRYAETAWLPWISQILGTSSTNAMTDLESRQTILNSTAGLYSGTERSIIQSVTAVLTGNKNVAIRRNRTATGVGGIWDLLIITVESETPIGFDFQKYLIEQGVKPAGVVIWNSTYNATWETLNTERPTWGDWTNRTWQEIMETGI